MNSVKQLQKKTKEKKTIKPRITLSFNQHQQPIAESIEDIRPTNKLTHAIDLSAGRLHVKTAESNQHKLAIRSPLLSTMKYINGLMHQIIAVIGIEVKFLTQILRTDHHISSIQLVNICH